MGRKAQALPALYIDEEGGPDRGGVCGALAAAGFQPRMMMRNVCCVAFAALFLACCSGKEGGVASVQEEDAEAKRLLQGVWMNEDGGEPSFRMEGDTIFFPDTVSAPQRFSVIGDTMFMYGVNVSRYKITSLTENVFEFSSYTDETVRVVKSHDGDADTLFFGKGHAVINQCKTIKRDTVVMAGGERYHCYLQVNPTTYRVYKSTYNSEGVEVDNVYYDNSVYLSLFNGTRKLYGHEFRKADFARHIPGDVLQKTILSDITLDSVAAGGLYYYAMLAVPDSPTSYILRISLSLGDSVTVEISGGE